MYRIKIFFFWRQLASCPPAFSTLHEHFAMLPCCHVTWFLSAAVGPLDGMRTNAPVHGLNTQLPRGSGQIDGTGVGKGLAGQCHRGDYPVSVEQSRRRCRSIRAALIWAARAAAAAGMARVKKAQCDRRCCSGNRGAFENRVP